MAMPNTNNPTNPSGSASGGTGSREVSLYERWQKIYPQWVSGGFQRQRRIVLTILLAIFYISPWLTWNGGPAVWFNLPERKFIMLSATFWPQEFVLFSWLLIICAFSLFVFTVVAGRLWCGWACPQTVWTLCFFYIERFIEGDRNQRLRLDRGSKNLRWLGRKSLKWSIWAVLAFSISITFVGYFTPIRDLFPKIVALDLGPWEGFWLFFVAGASFLMSGVLREQVCFHMCPYARFQSVMFDRDTLIISYDGERGEPRGSRSRAADPAALSLGSCIDCKLCVNVCPTGIDIREGLQYQCIGCAACIDVCDTTMEKMGYAPGLIRYSSENEDEHATTHKIRPRLLGYGAVLVAMISLFTWSVSHRVPLALDIIRDRNRLYRAHWDGSVENVYTLRIMNREQRDRTYEIRAEGDVPLEYGGKNVVNIEAGTQLSLPIRLVMSPDAVTSETNTLVEFTVEADGAPPFIVTAPSRFLRPDDQEGAD